MRIGIPELIILAFVLSPVVVAVFFVFFYRMFGARRAKRFGYGSTTAYLRSAPRSDAEKRDAVDLALKGLVLCGVGLIFPPFILAGLVPLFYGGRKVVYASMGLGLVDDADEPAA